MGAEKTNILLVDDRPENLLALEAVLESENYGLFKATSGREALLMVLKYQFDLVLLDVQMPEMDGFEVAELLRCKKESKGIPIIFITAISKEPQYINKGYEVGAENYLFKPIEPDMLRRKVNTALEYSQYQKRMQLLEKRVREIKTKKGGQTSRNSIPSAHQ